MGAQLVEPPRIPWYYDVRGVSGDVIFWFEKRQSLGRLMVEILKSGKWLKIFLPWLEINEKLASLGIMGARLMEPLRIQ